MEYLIWTIGVTDDPKARRSKYSDEGEITRYWSQWKADSESDARYIEKYFIAKGMKEGTGGGGTANFVYVF